MPATVVRFVDHPDSSHDVAAFNAFVADLADRCDQPPLARRLPDPGRVIVRWMPGY